MSKVDIVKGKALNKLIADIGNSANRLTNQINVACHSAALHVLEHGNTTPINNLCDAAKNVTHNNAVNRWFAEYCNWVKWDTKEKSFVLKPELRKAVLLEDGTVDPDVVEEYMATLIDAKSYIEFTPPAKFNGVSVIGMLKAIEKRVAKATEEAEAMEAVDPDEAQAMRAKIDTTGLEDVRSMLKRMAA